MKSKIAFVSLCLLMLGGCASRHVVERERVIETPGPSASAASPSNSPIARSSPMACALGGAVYNNGTLSCQNGMQYMCNNGMWDSRNVGC